VMVAMVLIMKVAVALLDAMMEDIIALVRYTSVHICICDNTKFYYSAIVI